MIREASIKIRVSRLYGALLSAGVDKDDLPLLVNTIISSSKKDNLSHRSLIVDNKTKEKSAAKALTSTDSDTDFFNGLLFLLRKKAKHRVRSKYIKGSKDYTIIMKASELALDFCNEFSLSRKEGFTKYISIFLTLNKGRFWLANLISRYESYCEYYEAEKLVKLDNNVVLTQELINLFEGEIMRITGLTDETVSILDRANFVKASGLCVELGINGTDYMSAQFEGLDFLGGIPHISQLANDKAKGRVIKYMAKYNIKSKLKSAPTKKIDWTKIIDHGN